MSLGKRIETLRIDRGWNKKELAERSKLHPSVITLLERDAIPNVRTTTLQKVADALGIPLSCLLNEDQQLNEVEDEDLELFKKYRNAIRLAHSLGITESELNKLIEAAASMFKK